ncbi:MAG: hypothetical protein QOJ95_1329 [Mycobacterium sp.]|nr:hypothetical protein [Mycobacterium sp.]
MKPKKIVAAVMIAGGLGLGSSAMVAPMASAQPAAPIPLKPGHGNDDYCPPWCGDTKGPNRYCPPWCDQNAGHGDDKGQWWNTNRHDWWDDRNGPPPWGWGPPPPIQWNGGPPPQSVNYWGYNLNPVWNDGPRQWGVWLFGLWIPIFGVGFN